MVDELNYLSERIETLEASIDYLESDNTLINDDCFSGKIEEFTKEKELLENILNFVTIELINK